MLRPPSIGLLGILVVAAGACGGNGHGRGPDPVVVGAIYNLTGPQSELDIPSSRGAQLAVDQMNRLGGVSGRRVDLALEDGETNPQVIATKTAALLKRFDPMPALLRAAGRSEAILGGDGLDSEGLWAQHPEIGDVFFTTHAYLGADNTDPVVIAFREAYEAAYPGTTPDAFSALGYDTTRLVLSAIEAAGSDSADAVRAALATTQGFEGVTGTISYGDGDRIPSKSVTIVEIEQGARRFVEELVPAKVPPP